MQQQIITIYCLCADFLQADGHKYDPQARITTAEVMTVAIVAATFFVGNQDLSRRFLKEHGYIPKMLSKSRFNRRLHALPDTLWQAVFALLAEAAKQTNPTQEYLVESYPVPVWDNIRIFPCTDYGLEDFLAEAAEITLTVPRKKNSKRPHPGWVTYLCERTRKRVETTFSGLTQLFARGIHAVTPHDLPVCVRLVNRATSWLCGVQKPAMAGRETRFLRSSAQNCPDLAKHLDKMRVCRYNMECVFGPWGVQGDIVQRLGRGIFSP